MIFLFRCWLRPSYIMPLFNTLAFLILYPLCSQIFLHTFSPITNPELSKFIYISNEPSHKCLHRLASFIKFPWLKRKPKNPTNPAPSKKRSFSNSNNSNPQKTPQLLKLSSPSSDKPNSIPITSSLSTVPKKPHPIIKPGKQVTSKPMTKKFSNSKALLVSNANHPFWRADNLSTINSLDSTGWSPFTKVESTAF